MASAIRAAFDAAVFVARALRPRVLKGPRVPSRPLPRVPRTPRIAFAALALGVAATGVKEARAHTQMQSNNSNFTFEVVEPESHLLRSSGVGSLDRTTRRHVEEPQTNGKGSQVRHHPRAPGPRELRFSSFASLRFQGRPYMTPSDFVDSVTCNSPRDDAPKRILTEKEVESILAKTPALDERRSQLFHSMGQNGLISYSDYLFLLCILTKPLAGFQIAFNMLDADGNQHIDKTEFLMMQEIFNSRNERRVEAGSEECATMPVKAASVKRHGDTTLLVHLFGRNGDKELDYQDFYRFTTALQEEVVWREFSACAHGRRVISEGAFARVLLRYTDVRDAAAITENLAARVPAGQGISFEEFHSFFQFLNNLEDFSIAVQMYTRAGLAIGQDEFRRAVRVATGLHLSPHLVCTVFHLFDEDGDGRLSHTEFLGVMRDRLRRGARDHRTSPKKDDYRTCVRRELSR